MVQTPDPTIRHGRHDYALRLPAIEQSTGKPCPLFIEQDQPMRRLDEHRPQMPVARLDQSGIRLPHTARCVPRTQAAEPGQLFAAAETIKATDLRPNGLRGHRADAGLFHQGMNE